MLAVTGGDVVRRTDEWKYQYIRRWVSEELERRPKGDYKQCHLWSDV